jgi:outer membrane protein OmpA-like peptidoglycan-associated protein
MKKPNPQNKIRIHAKRNVELWIYSFADMYMILSVFFIALSVIYAAKVKQQVHSQQFIASAGRGPGSVLSELELEFDNGSADLSAKTLDEMTLLLPALKQVKDGFIEVEGYADNGGLKKSSAFSSNLDLSNRRAVRVAEWLIKNGVSARRVRTFSYGDAHTWSKDVIASNRRVVIKVAAYGDKK